MCNRVVQNEVEVKPGGQLTVLMRGPVGEYELPFTEAIFGGPAKKESRNYWIKREGAEDVIVPDVSRFGEKNKDDGRAGMGGRGARIVTGGIAAASATGQDIPAPQGSHAARDAGSTGTSGE